MKIDKTIDYDIKVDWLIFYMFITQICIGFQTKTWDIIPARERAEGK